MTQENKKVGFETTEAHMKWILTKLTDRELTQKEINIIDELALDRITLDVLNELLIDIIDNPKHQISRSVYENREILLKLADSIKRELS